MHVRESFCTDCGAESSSRHLIASRYGGDPVCQRCEALRDRQAASRRLLAHPYDMTLPSVSAWPPWSRRG